MNWSQFHKAAPEVAEPGADRFRRTNLAMIGTLRPDGWPRISPVEPLFISEDLVLGMIWQSKKALDLLRDRRCILHSVVTEPDANEGEFKLRGLAIPATKQAYLSQIRERWRIAPSAPLHVFVVDILAASMTTYDFERGLMLLKRWRPEVGTVESNRTYP